MWLQCSFLFNCLSVSRTDWQPVVVCCLFCFVFYVIIVIVCPSLSVSLSVSRRWMLPAMATGRQSQLWESNSLVGCRQTHSWMTQILKHSSQNTHLRPQTLATILCVCVCVYLRSPSMTTTRSNKCPDNKLRATVKQPLPLQVATLQLLCLCVPRGQLWTRLPSRYLCICQVQA